MGRAHWWLRSCLWRFVPAALGLVGGLAAGGATLPGHVVWAQGVTTAAIRGTVRMADGGDPEGPRVLVRNSGEIRGQVD